RLKGEEQAIGSLLIEKGEVITSSAIALLASQGITHIKVYRGLKIAVLSTGNELKKPWENASEDEIYDVNAFALIALLKEQGFDAHYGGVIPDDLSIATHYFSTMQAYDVIVTSGGVSMGEADFVEKALQSNGFKASFHGINIKPGKPTMFGVMNQTIVASMPGNPLAAYVNAFLFLIPLLKKQQGQKNFNFNCILALNGADFKVKSGRVNLVLGELRQEKFYAYDDNRYGSGMITPLHKTNAIAICDEETKSIEMGKTVKIVIFKSLFSKVIASLKN
ncbi:MAG: molybdopterin molybdotransferase MoeA, partial [Sulfurospirillum sp.]|nr:molybdopterin molybdotransferase MoeA [Sulfurospirillum sp.]